MILVSGSPPYEYESTLPVRAVNPYTTTDGIGASGILLEQAEFVIAAELRKFSILPYDPSILPDYFTYTNTNVAPSGPYEPKSDGSTVNNLLNPTVLCVNKIEDLRNALDSLFAAYAFDTFADYKFLTRGDVHKSDWIRQAFPHSPSGHNPIDYFGNPTTIGDYLRPLPDIGQNFDTDQHYLGGSGVLLDIDFAEVIFQPYPFTRFTRFGDMQPGSQQFLVQCSPLFPAFQKTDGNVISTNGREPTRAEIEQFDPSIVAADASHVSSGFVRLDGYCLHPSSTYMLAQYTGENFTPSNTNDFDYYTGEPRYVTLVGPIPINDNSLRAFIAPHVAASGVYRFVVKNSKAAFPKTAVESGIVSIFPPENITYPTTTNSGFGYHVFDDAIWITSNSGGSTLDGPPSGLAVMSPFTGHMMWVSKAEDANKWGTSRGLAQTGTSLYRVQRNVSAAAVNFTQYDSATLDELSVTSSAYGGGTGQSVDLFFDGTNYWMTNTLVNSYYRFDAAFGYTDVQVPARGGRRGAYINGKLLGFGDTASGGMTSGIVEWTFAGGLTTVVATKKVNGAPFIGNRAFGVVHDMIEVTGASHVTNGTWALVSWGTTFGNQNIYLVRLEEAATTWEILAFYILARTQTTISVDSLLDITYIPIP